MSPTQLTITLAIAMAINQWVIAIFNRRSKQASPKAKPVSNVATKAKRSRFRYASLVGDVLILGFAIYAMFQIVGVGRIGVNVPTPVDLSIRLSIMISVITFIIMYQAKQVISGVVALFFS